MKKNNILLLTLLLVFLGFTNPSLANKCISDGVSTNSGTYENGGSCVSCGLNCDWEITGSKLTIYPSEGASDVEMRSFTNSQYAPWRNSGITEAVIEEGITVMGEYGFFEVRSLSKVTLPQSLTRIGYGTFNQTALTSITLPENLQSMSGAIFANSRVNEVTFPSNITSIGGDMFTNDSSLVSIYIPDGVTSISSYAFKNTYNLRNIYCIDTNGQCERLRGILGSTLNGKTFTVIPAVTGCSSYNAQGCAMCYGRYEQDGDQCLLIEEAKLRYTMEEAEALTTNDNNNWVEWTFE